MLGLAGLIDNLLTAKGSPPLDVRALQREGGVAAPGAVQPAGTVNNDVRLPSNAALDRLVPGALPPLTTPAAGTASARPDLSVAARAISVVLAQLQGDAGPVRSVAPAWPTAQAPLPAMLANALAQAVSDSGLFYESHLAQLAEGTRTEAQMLREPQARWGTAAPAPGAATSTAASSAAGLPVSGQALAAPLLETAGADAPATQNTTAPAARPAAGTAPPDNKLQGTAPAAAEGAEPAHAAADSDAQRVQAAYRHGEARPAVAPDLASANASAQGADARSAAGAGAGPVIHPQGMTLVHQQLDLLATDAFRWSGQAWPGVPMTWTIEAEPDHERAARDGAAEEGQRAWSTTVAMNLPHLGAVDILLSLDGGGLQARLQAGEAATATRLRAQGGALTQRLEAAGLRLQAFHVDAKGAA